MKWIELQLSKKNLDNRQPTPTPNNRQPTTANRQPTSISSIAPYTSLPLLLRPSSLFDSKPTEQQLFSAEHIEELAWILFSTSFNSFDVIIFHVNDPNATSNLFPQMFKKRSSIQFRCHFRLWISSTVKSEKSGKHWYNLRKPTAAFENSRNIINSRNRLYLQQSNRSVEKSTRPRSSLISIARPWKGSSTAILSPASTKALEFISTNVKCPQWRKSIFVRFPISESFGRSSVRTGSRL